MGTFGNTDPTTHFFTTPYATLEQARPAAAVLKVLYTPLKLCPALVFETFDMNRFSLKDAVCRDHMARTYLGDESDLTISGSWVPMFLTEPPSTSAVICLIWERNGDQNVSVWHTVEDDTGVKLGAILKLPSMRGLVMFSRRGPQGWDTWTHRDNTASGVLSDKSRHGSGSFKRKSIWIRPRSLSFSEHVAFPSDTDWTEMSFRSTTQASSAS